MFEILVPADGFAHFGSAIDEYARRMPRDLSIVRLSAGGSTDAPSIIRRETERLRTTLDRRPGYTILCDVQGRARSTEDLAAHLGRIRLSDSRIRFVVGGSYGVDTGLLSTQIRETLSLGPLTLPHGLAVLLLAEQLYRVTSIWRGSGYHHG